MSGSIFKEKVIVITGASSGIGRELAYQLAAQGAWLSLAARTIERLESVRTECEKRGAKAIALATDVSEPAQCEALIRQTVEHFSRLDMLVNNAGKTMQANFEDVRDPSIFEKLMRINYLGSVYCTYYALPYLKQTQGRIIGISSLTGKTGVPTRTGYAASKHAMAGFFDSLRIEVAQYHVSVTMIYPGFVATAIREQAFGEDGQSVGRSTVRESKAMPVETCTKIILQAAAQRKREVVMTWRGKIEMWLKLLAPGLVDRTARQAIRTGH